MWEGTNSEVIKFVEVNKSEIELGTNWKSN